MSREALRKPLRELDYSRMSDSELDALVAQEDTGDKFHVPQHMIPDGMVYQWVRTEVYGKPDVQNIARMQQKGWQGVPSDRHAGRWLPVEHKGPIIVDGLMLMELPEPLHKAKMRLAEREAKGAIYSLKEQLGTAPPGTAPRDAHPRTRPQIRHSYERAIDVE